MKSLILIVGLIFSINLSAKSNNLIEDALYLKITDSGFKVINKSFPTFINDYLKDIKFPNVSFSIPGVGRAIAKDIKFSLNMDKIEFVPREGHLDIDTIIENLKIDIGNIRIQDYFTGLVGFNCYKTRISLVDDLPFSTELGLEVKNRKVLVNPKKLKLNIKRHQFKTQGPRRCASLLNPNEFLLKAAVSKFLKSSRPIINVAIKFISTSYVTLINDIVNDIVNKFDIPIILPDLLVAPETRILASGFPRDIKVSSKGLEVKVDVFLRRGEIKDKLIFDNYPEVFSYASLDLSPKILNRLLEIIFDGTYTQDLEINSDLNEMVSELLTHGQFSDLLPELESIGEEDDQLKMFISINSPPIIKIDSSGRKILIEVPDLEMKLQIFKGGSWIDFFSFHHNLKLEMEVKKEADEIVANVSILEHKVDGKWADTYSPSDNVFYQDTAEEFFPMLLDMLLEVMRDRLKLEIPIFNLDGYDIMLGDIEVKDGKLYVDITSAKF